MEGSKIHLSEAELNMACNAGIILTKNTIIEKTIGLFQTLQEAMRAEKQSPAFTDKIFTIPPKISKGENYLGLPYVVLDYPRLSGGNDLCFIRTMFWWGNFFSSTLQISGSFKEEHLNTIAASYPVLSQEDYFVAIGPDPWHHHFEETNYKKIDGLTGEAFNNILYEKPYIKIAAKWPLKEWNLAATRLYHSWKQLISLIT